jgi:hypothetical protein
MYPDGSRDNAPKTHARKDVTIVGLANGVCLALVCDRTKWTATCKYALALQIQHFYKFSAISKTHACH